MPAPGNRLLETADDWWLDPAKNLRRVLAGAPRPSGRLGSHGHRRPAPRRAACFAYQSASHKSAMAITRPCDPSRVYFVCCCRFADDAPPEPGGDGPGSRDRHPTNFIATAVLFWEVFDDAWIARTNTLV
jgi:hypothetical protein